MQDTEIGKLILVLEAQYKDMATAISAVKTQVLEMSKDVEKDVKKAQGAFTNLGNEIKGSFVNALKSAVMAYVGFQGVMKIVDLVKSSIKAFDDLAVVTAKLNLQLGKAASANLIEYGKSLQAVTRFSKDELLQAEALLASFGRSEAQIKQLLPAILDFATATGMNATSVTQLFNRSLLSTGQNLGRYNLGITGAAGTQERLNSIVQKSTEYFGGQAKAIAQVGAGGLVIMTNQFKDMADDLGAVLIPHLVVFMEVLGDVLNLIKLIIPKIDDANEKAKSASDLRIANLKTEAESLKTSIASAKCNLVIYQGIDLNFHSLSLKQAKERLSLVERTLALEKSAAESRGKPPPDLSEGEKTLSAELPYGYLLPDQEFALALKINEVDIELNENREKLRQLNLDNANKAGLAMNKSIEKRIDDEKTLLKKSEDEHEAWAKRMTNIYVDLGRSIGDAIAAGIAEGGEAGLRTALAGIIGTFLDFLQGLALETIAENTLSNIKAAALVPGAGWIVGAAKGAAEAALITALFQSYKGMIQNAIAPKAAEGGLIVGRPHSRGGVVLEAEGNEYIHKKSVVDYYGVSAMEAINRRLIPREAFRGLSLSPTVPHGVAATGGLIKGGKQSTAIVNFVDPRLMEKYLASADGQRAIVNVIGYKSYEIRKALSV